MAIVQVIRDNKFRIKGCVASYPRLLTPEVTKNKLGRVINDTPRFTGKFIVPALTAEDDALLRKLYADAIAAKWGAQTPNFHPNNNCLKDPSSEGAQFTGRWCIAGSARADRPPQVLDQSRARMTPDRQSELFSGCIVTLAGHFYGYDQGAPGISFEIEIVRLTNNGPDVPRLDGRLGVDEALGDDDDDVVPAAPMNPVAGPAGLPAAPGLPPAPGAAPVPGPGLPPPPGGGQSFLQ